MIHESGEDSVSVLVPVETDEIVKHLIDETHGVEVPRLGVLSGGLLPLSVDPMSKTLGPMGIRKNHVSPG